MLVVSGIERRMVLEWVGGLAGDGRGMDSKCWPGGMGDGECVRWGCGWDWVELCWFSL